MAIYAGSIPQSLAGKSAYQIAFEAGYEGTEEEFGQLLYELPQYADLGSAALKNVPASGDAANGEVVLGNDTRLTDERTAKNIQSTYNAQDTNPINGVGVADALSILGSAASKDVTNTYSATGTDPVSGTAVADALGDFVQVTSTQPTNQTAGSLWFKIL